MSTDTDGAPPSVQRAPEADPDPRAPSGPEPVSAGSEWLQEAIRRRMAERSAGGGPRHAKRDRPTEPPRGVGHVPRHSVAPRTGPAPVVPAAAEPVAPARPAPPPAPVGGPSLPSSGVPVRGPAPVDNRWSGPEPASPPAPVDPPARVEPAAPAPPRRIPTAYTRGARAGAGAGPDTFGGPDFDAPATRRSSPVDATGSAVTAPPTRDLPQPVTPDPGRPSGPSPAGPADAAGAVPPSAPASPRLPVGSDVRPPARPARLLAAPPAAPPVGAAARRAPAPPGFPAPPGAPAPDAVVPVEALGRRPVPADLDPAERLDLTGPMSPVEVGIPAGADDLADPDEDTVLWSATMPPLVDGQTATATPAVPVELPSPRVAEPASNRVKIVFSERRGGAHPVRTVVDIQEGGAVGDLLRSDLIGSQLTVALRFALLAGLTLGLLPLAFALFPAIGRVELAGIRLPWLLLGLAVYPVLWGLGWWHTRVAERVEQDFADHVQE